MTNSVTSTTRRLSSEQPGVTCHIGLVVLGSLTFGLALCLLLVLGVFGGATESRITGGALVALGAGFMLLALASRRLTNQPKTWALAPGAASVAAGLGLLVISPNGHLLGLAGWVWAALLLILVGWSVRGARRSLHNWSRRALLYPALVVLMLVAVGGGFETVADATSATPHPVAARTSSMGTVFT